LVWAAGLVVVLAVLVAMLFAAVTTPPRPCQSVDAEKVSVESVERLREAGWYPIAGDGKEALYSPGCSTPGSGA